MFETFPNLEKSSWTSFSSTLYYKFLTNIVTLDLSHNPFSAFKKSILRPMLFNQSFVSLMI